MQAEASHTIEVDGQELARACVHGQLAESVLIQQGLTSRNKVTEQCQPWHQSAMRSAASC